MKYNKIAPEIREQIINRIKNEGVTIVQAAKDHGIPESTISTWIARKVEVHPTCMTGSGGDSVIDETIVERFTEDQLDSAATYIAKVADVKDVSRPIRT